MQTATGNVTKKSAAKGRKQAQEGVVAVVEAQQTAMADIAVETTPETVVTQELPVVLLDLNKIVNSTYNPRKNFREETLLELAESIRHAGVLQPICVRPKDEGYEIVYGERRYWAAAMANQTHIPAIIRMLSDAEAEDAAITENLQREDITPREEAAAYKRALESARHTIESLVGKFGKSEGYIRSRLNLCSLIDALAEQLDKEEISVGVALEVAKYDATVQQEVYDEHFADDCRSSWKNARIKEVATRLYERYMTKLEQYRFDKSDCTICGYNTANQVLFADCAESCAGCQNQACMIRKNIEYLVQKTMKMLSDDPRTMLMTTSDSSVAEVIEQLEAQGYQVGMLSRPLWSYEKAPKVPVEPQADEYDTAAEYEDALRDYKAELIEFIDETQALEFAVSEGKTRKYAVIRNLEVEVRYEEVPVEQEVITTDGRRVLVATIPESPTEALRKQDCRNRELCYEHITVDLKRVLSDKKTPKQPLQKEEQQMFYYALMRNLPEERFRECGFKIEDKYWIKPEEQFAAAGRITEKQKAALVRSYLMGFFRNAQECRCTDETLDTKLLCQFADLNFKKESEAVQQQYLAVFEKRHARLHVQIDAIEQQVAEAAAEASAEQAPAPEIEEPMPVPDSEEYPFIETPEPLIIPTDPEIESERLSEMQAA